MFAKKLLFTYSCQRIKNDIINDNIKLNNEIELCFKQYKPNRKYIKDLYKKFRENNDKLENINLFDFNNFVIEDDWIKLITYYENNYVVNLLPLYKVLFNNIKHLRNDKFLELLSKIHDEKIKMNEFLNNKKEHETFYFSKLTEKDFYI